MGSEKALIKLGTVLDGLEYDFSKFNIHDFVEWIAERRKRPIYLKPWRFTKSIFGAWLPKDDFDLIYYEPGLAEVHTIHILLHELSHMLLNHIPIQINEKLAFTFRAASDIDLQEFEPTIVGLCRSIQYSNEQEKEAEILSSLIQTRVFRLIGLESLTHISQNPAMTQFMQGIGSSR